MQIGKPLRSITVEPLEVPARPPESESDAQMVQNAICALSRTSANAPHAEEQPMAARLEPQELAIRIEVYEKSRNHFTDTEGNGAS
jgi:hypothetical protein